MTKPNLIPAEDALTITKADVAALSPPSIMQAITLAVDKQSPIEVLERLWALQIQVEAATSKRLFDEAFAKFQAELPDIERDSPGHFGPFASVDNIRKKILPLLNQYGLTHHWEYPSDLNNETGVTSVISGFGHERRNTMYAELDKSGGKNTIQAKGSTKSYLERYTFRSNVGATISGVDDDGQQSGGTMENLADWLDAIAGCNSLEQLKTEYLKALNVADEAKDTQAAGRLTFAHTRRARELRAQK